MGSGLKTPKPWCFGIEKTQHHVASEPQLQAKIVAICCKMALEIKYKVQRKSAARSMIMVNIAIGKEAPP